MSKVAVFGVDGVLADLNGLIVEMYGVGRGEQYYGIDERYTENVAMEIASVLSDPNYYYGLDAIDDGFSFVLDAARRGYQVLFLSSRTNIGSMENFTRRWLDKELRERGYSLQKTLGLKMTEDKATHLKKSGLDISFFVDENPEEIELSKRAKINAFSWAQPWNEHVFPKLYPYSGDIAVQIHEWAEGEYFWNYIKQEK